MTLVRYLFSVIASQSGPVPASDGEMEAIDAFNEKIQAAGQRIIALGVAEPSSAIVFDNRDSAGQISTGPVSNSDLFMAGFWVIEADNDSVAHALAAEASLACNRQIEVRPILG